MGKLLMIGRWVKGKHSILVDLKTYREMKKERQKKEAKDGKISKGTEEKGKT